MKIIKENNIASTIIFAGMFMIASLMVFSSYYFITKQYEILERSIEDSKDAYVVSQRKLIRREVDSIIEIIRFKRAILSAYDQEQYKEELQDWIRSIRFGSDKKNYLIIYKIENFAGGDKFAKMLVNANRPDLEGKYISSEYEDAHGKKFRKMFLKEINIYGYAFVDYMYKKLDSDDIRPKVSYFRLYPQWNWVIGAGAYLDGINKDIEIKKSSLKKHVQMEITSSIFIFIFFSMVASAFAIFFGKQIEKVLRNKNIQVKQKREELKKLNRELLQRVQNELQKNREQEQLLIQKSKFIALGEMISNIAHQWRQPLSELSAIMMTLKFKHNLGKLDTNVMSEKSKDAENLLEYMSKTIDDFREFFMPSREKKKFFAKEAVDAVISIIGTSAKEKNISLHVEIPENEKIYGHKNEFEQVLLNVITNAKNILLSKKTMNPTIGIKLSSDEQFTYLSISDNAGGIEVEPIDKIFQPYFTTREDSGGTGIGLYMSKLIIEKNMGGILMVKNSEIGAIFTIRLKKVD